MTIEAQEQKNSAEIIDNKVNDQLKTVDANAVKFETTDVPLNSKNVKSFLATDTKLNFGTIDVSNSQISLDDAFDAVIKDIFPNKTSIEMNDIYALSDTQKADLAWKIVSIQPLSDAKKNESMRLANGSFVPYGSIETALLYGLSIGTDTKLPQGNNYAPRGVQLDVSAYSVSRQDFENYSKAIAQYKNDMFKNVFKSFYVSGDVMPAVVPTTYALATGDLRTSTTGIGGVGNLGRESFIYDFDSQNTQLNSVRFGSSKNDLHISVGAEGIDKIGGEITFIFTSPEGKEYAISGTYTSEGLVLQKDPALKGITVNGNMITIPKEYKDRDIKVQTKSNQYTNGSYDEIVFPLSTDGIIGKRPNNIGEAYAIANNLDYKLGKYELTDQQLLSIQNTILDIGDYGKRVLADTLPITLYAGVNDVSIPDDDINPRFLQNKDIFADNGFTVIKNTLQSAPIKKLWTDYQQKIDVMSAEEMGNPAWSGEQLQAQKLLTKLRMLTVLEQMDKNYDVKTLLGQGKLSVAFDYKNEKASGLEIKTFDMITKE